jgi:hypothetical protein
MPYIGAVEIMMQAPAKRSLKLFGIRSLNSMSKFGFRYIKWVC